MRSWRVSMTEGDEPANPADETLVTLRLRVLKVALSLVAAATTSISALLMAQAAADGTLTRRTVLLCVFTLSFPLLRLLTPRLGFLTSACTFLTLLSLVAFVIEVNGGITVASTMLSMIAVLLAGIFFGAHGAVLVLLGSLLAFTTAGILVVGGAAPVALSTWNPLRPALWIRQGVAYVLFGAAITTAVVYVVQRLEAAATQLRRTLEQARADRAALDLAEAERQTERTRREEAQQALAEGQRSEALGRMAAGIAHDFNNSLTVIMNAAGLGLLEPNVPEGVRGSFSEIEFAAQRAARLTKELLMFAQRDVAQPRALRVDEALGQLTGPLRRLLPSNIALSVDAQSRAVVRLDETQFERVMMNLAVNARDAITPSGGQIAIKCRATTAAVPGAPPAQLVVLEVSDTGAGMDDATRARIFEPFFTTKGLGKGTGLGLALVESIVREAGGSVSVTSAPGRGSTFELHLPSVDETDAAALISGDAMPPPADSLVVPPLPPQVGRILLADDRHDVRITMSRALAHAGFEVETAADGDQALAALERLAGTVDLLCIDAVMPGTGTATVIDRAVSRYPGIKVLLCSGHVEADLLRRGIAAGRYAFLQKPFTSLELIARVRRELGRSDQR